MRAIARQLQLWREAAGLTQAEFGAAIGYGEELVSSKVDPRGPHPH